MEVVGMITYYGPGEEPFNEYDEYKYSEFIPVEQVLDSDSGELQIGKPVRD